MTESLSLETIYVEGGTDVDVLDKWFPQLTFNSAGGKDEVQRQVEEDTRSYGLLDRDFASNEEVAASHEPDSRVLILDRYTIENYLVEPSIIGEAVGLLSPDVTTDETRSWLDEEYARQRIHEWGDELALYAAANSIVSEWRESIMFDRDLGFLRYFGPLPPLPRADVVASLQRRLAALPTTEEIENLLNARYERVTEDVSDWLGLHRWIHGKVLLENYLYPRVFEPIGISQSRARDLLIEAGRTHISADLRDVIHRLPMA